MDKNPFPTQDLITGLEYLSIPYTTKQLTLCEEFFYEYSEQMNKISISTIENPQDFIQKHILDSLTAYPWLKKIDYIADLGSGGGFPGIILAIFLPESFITLIDVVEKKVQYLKDIINKLKLNNVKAYNASKAKVPGRFDMIVSRAVGNLAKIILYAKPYLQVYTKILAYKGRNETIQEELEGIKSSIAVKIYPVQIPFLDAQRHIVLLDELKA